MAETARNEALATLGWTEAWESKRRSSGRDGNPYRVVRHDGIKVLVSDGTAVVHATFPRSMALTVGDWVLVSHETVTHRLERTSELARDQEEAGSQVIAANIDVVLVVFGADRPLRDRKVMRFVAFAWDIGATPVVILSKIDLVDDPGAIAATIASWVGDVPLLTTSVETGDGIDDVFRLLEGRTGTLLGESGAGKSSLVNALMAEEVAWVGDVRETDAKGRHTTTHRELHLLPGGGMIIDNPGIRALGLAHDGFGVESLYADIDELAVDCRFRDCAHRTEPGCAVRAAVDAGEIDDARVEAYRSFLIEQTQASQRMEEHERLAASKRDAAAARRAREGIEDPDLSA